MITELLDLTDRDELLHQDSTQSTLLLEPPTEQPGATPFWRANHRRDVRFDQLLMRLDPLAPEIERVLTAIWVLLDERPDDTILSATQITSTISPSIPRVYAILALAILSSEGLLRRKYAIEDLKTGRVSGCDPFDSINEIPFVLENDLNLGTFTVSDGNIVDVYERVE